MNKDINFEYIEDFVDYAINEVENDDDAFVTVIAKFDEAKKILKDIMQYDDVNFEALEIESPIMDNYDDAFVISLWMNDGVLEIGCEKLKDDEGDYTNPSGDIVFMFDNCSSKIIPLCEGSDLYFVNIEDECGCDEECGECCSCSCHRSDTELTNTDETSYKINGKSVSKQEFEKKYDEIKAKYDKNYKDMLLKHCEFMDEVNNMLSRLW